MDMHWDSIKKERGNQISEEDLDLETAANHVDMSRQFDFLQVVISSRSLSLAQVDAYEHYEW